MKKLNKKAIGLIGLIVGVLVLVIVIMAIIKPAKVAFEQKIKAPDLKKSGEFAPFKSCEDRGFPLVVPEAEVDEKKHSQCIDSGIEGFKCCTYA